MGRWWLSVPSSTVLRAAFPNSWAKRGMTWGSQQRPGLGKPGSEVLDTGLGVREVGQSHSFAPVTEPVLHSTGGGGEEKEGCRGELCPHCLQPGRAAEGRTLRDTLGASPGTGSVLSLATPLVHKFLPPHGGPPTWSHSTDHRTKRNITLEGAHQPEGGRVSTALRTSPNKIGNRWALNER